MCIQQSVGAGGTNKTQDVKIVQILLNMNLTRPAVVSNILPGDLPDYAVRGAATPRLQREPILRTPLPLNGKVSPEMLSAIEWFQRNVVKMANPDRKVSAGGKTVELMKNGLPYSLNEEILMGIMADATAGQVKQYFLPLVQTMTSYMIVTPRRQAHFLAQIGHESGDFVYSEEVRSGEAYEGRADLGNTETGDGKRFKGRGLIQLTGRANYQAYGDYKGQDFTTGDNMGKIATDPNLATDVAGWFWTEYKDLNELADRDDINAITYKINGGYNGLAERKVHLARAKFFLRAP